MDLKVGNKVRFIGGEKNVRDDTPQRKPVKKYYHPIDGVHNPKVKFTYIWLVIPSDKFPPLYLISHHNGERREFFTDPINKDFFGEIDVSKMDSNQNYIYAEGEELILLNEKGEIIIEEEKPTSEEKPNPSNSSESLEDEQKDDVPSTNSEGDESKKFQPLGSNQPINTDSSKEEERQVSSETNTGVDPPYYTPESIPFDLMVDMASVISPVKVMKQTEVFTVLTVTNEIIFGRGGDFLILSQEGNLSIEPKETFNKRFIESSSMATLKIGADDVQYTIPIEVGKYIANIQEVNQQLRDKTFATSSTKKGKKKVVSENEESKSS